MTAGRVTTSTSDYRGVRLVVMRDRWVWRRWRWLVFEQYSPYQTDGRAFRRATATAHGELVRALRIGASNVPPDRRAL
jgi:hypothetical protein